jgi:hypothetical protein
MTLDDRLNRLAAEGSGEISVGPEAGQDLESFQPTVRRLRGYQTEGFIEIISEKQDSRSSQRHVARVRIRLTPSGVAWRKNMQSGQ